MVYRDIERVEPYVAALAAAGLEPVPVPAGPQASLSGCGGLVLMGGSDVDPARYGEPREPQTEPPDDELDFVESSMLEDALAQDLPVLAICRGLQLVNVFHGGTLIQHLSSASRHSRPDGARSSPVHEVTIQPETLLYGIEGTGTMPVNSRHHQAVKTLGKGLRVSAVDDEDGTVEALERPDRRFVLAVQWHPEDQASQDPRQAKLFSAFAAAVAGPK
jgi:gamma-glutamyl-gamma-aminobutyrate hydrolase PuuD